MDEQLEAISTRLRRKARQACDRIISGLDEELLALKSASEIQHYEDLQYQHKLVVESCEKLRTENVHLQEQLKELLARESAAKVIHTPEPTARIEKQGKRSSSRQISSSIQNLIDENPELQAILDEQAADYKKLQAAHGLLLQKLKEHQEAIIQLQRESTNSAQLPANNEERLAHLRSIISPSRDSLIQPHGSPSRSPRGSLPATAEYAKPAPDENPQGIDLRPVSDESREVISLDSSPPEATVGEGDRRKVAELATIALTNTNQKDIPVVSVIPANSTTSDSSQPVFVSERPAKRRRTGHMEVSRGRAIKSEHTMSEPDILGESHSIDLDAVPMPIILPETRSYIGGPLALSTEVSETDATTTKRHSEPPMKTKSISLDIDQEPATEVSIKNENNLQGAHSSENSLTELPPPSSSNSYFQEKPQRTVLQPKPSNVRNAFNLLGEKARLSIEEKGIGSNKTNKIGNTRTSGPVTVPNLEILDLERQAIETNLAKSSNTGPSITGKYQTALQKKRGQAERRLRDRSIHELSLNDFILNPAMNQGFNQAIGEIDTWKTSKRCLPDCSKPECCGIAFATAVQNAGIASLQDLSIEEKDSLIQSYLGFPVSTLGLLSNQGYQKLLGEAIGKQFAEKYGKHKQVRANSPPGYWRAEFPSTQERETDKRRAEQIEKALIVERRREALRNGGLWVFRDE